MPALGLDQKIKIQFLHGCKKVREKDCACLPVVSTCSLTLTLPVHVCTFEDTMCVMKEAVMGSLGFGRV